MHALPGTRNNRRKGRERKECGVSGEICGDGVVYLSGEGVG